MSVTEGAGELSRAQLEALIPLLEAQKRSLAAEDDARHTVHDMLEKKKRGARLSAAQKYFAVSLFTLT